MSGYPYRVAGSAGYVNAVRAAFVLIPDAQDEDLKLFLPIKFNVGRKPKGLSFRIESLDAATYERILAPFDHLDDEDRHELGKQMFRIRWEGAIDDSADAVLGASGKRGRGANKVDSAADWLKKTGVRWVPIFPELRPYLDEAFDLAAEGAVFLITRYRCPNCNLRTQLNRILRRTGLEPWPKLFHNLRATRETELAEVYPIHVVCSWIGHTAAIAQKHYLQVRDEDFDRAADPNSAPNSALSVETAQNTPQHRARTERARNAETPDFSGVSCEEAAFSAGEGVPRVGIEPTGH